MNTMCQPLRRRSEDRSQVSSQLKWWKIDLSRFTWRGVLESTSAQSLVFVGGAHATFYSQCEYVQNTLHWQLVYQRWRPPSHVFGKEHKYRWLLSLWSQRNISARLEPTQSSWLQCNDELEMSKVWDTKIRFRFLRVSENTRTWVFYRNSVP